MKHKLLLAGLMLLLGLSASAETYNGTCGTNLTWTLDTETGVLAISGTGAMKYYSNPGLIPWSSYRDFIISAVLSDGVTSIEQYAFRYCNNMTSVTIPNSVTSIGYYSFSECSGLTSITIPNSVTKISTCAFEKCSRLTAVTIGSSVLSFGDVPFSGCKIDKIDFLGTLDEWCNKSWSPGVISNSYSLSMNGSIINDAIISNNVTTIGSSAFDGCSGLTSVTIPNSVTSIGNYAFYGCSSLGSVTIGNSVTTIGEKAFSGCSSLTSVTIPNSVTSIGSSAFYGCSSLTSVTIGNSVTSIGSSAFYGCSSLTSVTIPNSVTSIGGSAFSGCSSLGSVIIGNSVTSIGESAFAGCSSLCSLTVGNSVETIGKSAFPQVAFVTFEGMTPPSVTTFPLFGTAIVPAEALETYKAAWSDYANQIIANDPAVNHQEINVTAKPDKSAIHIAIGDANLGNVISLKVTGSINSYDIMIIRNKMINLQELDLTDCDIVANSYEYYSGYHSEDSVLTSYCFSNTPIQKARLPKSLKKIHRYTLNSSKLRYLEINGGNLVVSAFSGYSMLDTVIVNNATLGGKDFAQSSKTAPLKYVKLYNVPDVSYSSFYDCTSLNTVLLGDSVTSIGSYAFSGCTALKNIALPNILTSIGNAAFARCSSLTEIALPSSLKTIGEAAFMGAGLTSVIIPASVSSIGQYAFAGAKKNSYTIGDIARQYYSLTPVSITIGNWYVIFDNSTYYFFDSSVSSIQIGQYYYFDSGNKTVYNARVDSYGGYEYYESSLWKDWEDVSSDRIKNVYRIEIREGQLWRTTGDFSGIKYGFESSESFFKDIEKKNYYKTGFFGGTLQSVIFEKGSPITVFNKSVFEGNNNLKNFVFPENLHLIDHMAMAKCAIDSLVIPESVKMINYLAFIGANSRYIRLPQSITDIPPYAVAYCPNLKEVVIPTNVETVADYAFYGCTNLEEIRVASSIRNIGNYAFAECPNVEKVYTYTVEPTQINQNTFSCWQKANLYVPYTSYYTYFYNTQWSQFLRLIEFDEPYDYFYVNNDYELGANGTIDGSPDVDLNPGSGLIVTGDDTQNLGDVTQHINDNYSAAIVACKNALVSENLNIKLTMNKDYWYFLCLPFNLSLSSVTWPGQYAVYEYDGAARAQNGSGGWKKMTGETLTAGKGYIVRSSVNGDVLIHVANPVFSCETFTQQLPVHTAGAAYNANWTLIGNPFPAYYNMDDLFAAGFKAPVYVYNKSRNDYDVYMPHDDEYHFHPYEAFFVQNPGTTAGVINWTGDGRETYRQSLNPTGNAPARRRVQAQSNRRFVELNLRQAEGDAADHTRIVFNPAAEMQYELGTDAFKMQGEAPVRLYSLDTETQYAINERPYDNGYTALGFHVATDGFYTLSASRLDTAIALYDNVLQQPVDLTQGDYTFYSKAGTDNTRFGMRLVPQTPTDIQTVQALYDGKVDVYTLLGLQLYKDADALELQLPAGVYIFRSNEQTRTVILK